MQRVDVCQGSCGVEVLFFNYSPIRLMKLLSLRLAVQFVLTVVFGLV